MFRKLALIAAAFVATTTGASAKNYNISFDGYCNTFSFSIINDLAVGVSDGITSLGACDDANLVGSMLRLPLSVAPKGSVVALASDFGGPETFGAQYIVYLSLSAHTWVMYGTGSDGSSQIAVAGTWSELKTGDSARSRARLPSLRATLMRKAKSGHT